MPAKRVVRPIVRSFSALHLREASAHVRAGGHAIVWTTPRKALLVVPKPDDDSEQDLSSWSLLDLGINDYKLAPRGHFRGLAVMPVPRDCHSIVRRRVERDSVHPGPSRTVAFDCLECGACCRDNNVILDDDDIARFKAASRGALAKPPYAKREDGKMVLKLGRNKACKHLAGDNKCGIYAIRPSACSTFPVASECCLSAREDELGVVDGVRPGG